MSEKKVYFFGDGRADGQADMKNLLGGKGANLAEMTRLGVPVPPADGVKTPTTASSAETSISFQSLRKSGIPLTKASLQITARPGRGKASTQSRCRK